MSARSRRKGIAWEREVARLLNGVGIPAARCLTETRDGNVGDLTFPPDVRLTVQAKVGARPDLYGAVREAVEAAPPGYLPLAIIRRNGSGGRPPWAFSIPKKAHPSEAPAMCTVLVSHTDT